MPKAGILFQAALCRYNLADYAGAAENLETALSLANDTAYAEKKPIYNLLRMVYAQKPDYVKLAELCRILMGVEEDKPGLLFDLLNAYTGLSRWEEMARVFDEFSDIELDANAVLRKVRCLKIAGRYKEAFQASREYIEKFGEDHMIFINLMDLCYDVGDGDNGFAYYKKAIEQCDAPDRRLKIGSLLFALDAYQGAISDGEFPDLVNDMRRSTEKLIVNTSFDNTLKPFRKIRIGYLSADFRTHPVGYFLSPVISNTRNCHCRNFCFNLAQPNDAFDMVTSRFKSMADNWAEVFGLPDLHVERLFLDNKIDIAFDMMCHSSNNRLQLYARRLAPLQISWIGFPVTSGVAAMDYVITDKNVDPPGSEKFYAEKLLYMPDCFLCQTVKSGLEAAQPAFTRNGYITFACFHALVKVTDKTLRMWRKILERSENSRLVIMGRLPACKEGSEILAERFRKIGMPMDRINILPHCEIKDYFAAYNDVDIMLDTHPFSGATTTFDALRMGRPIITLVGERHVSRVSYSLLKHVELEDLAAFSEEEYVEKAVALAGDHERLRKINADLPGWVENSPLTNQSAFRINFEKIIRDIWIKYCFEKRSGYYDYREDSPAELFEQVINATIYIERKLDAGESIDGALAAEYHRAQKALCEKLNLVTNNEEFTHEYEKFVRAIGRRLGEKELRLAIAIAKQYISRLTAAGV